MSPHGMCEVPPPVVVAYRSAARAPRSPRRWVSLLGAIIFVSLAVTLLGAGIDAVLCSGILDAPRGPQIDYPGDQPSGVAVVVFVIVVTGVSLAMGVLATRCFVAFSKVT